MFFCASKNENWFHANSEFLLTIELQLRVERSNNYHFQKSLLLSGLRVGAQLIFNDLDLPPFQNKVSSTCNYFPE